MLLKAESAWYTLDSTPPWLCGALVLSPLNMQPLTPGTLASGTHTHVLTTGKATMPCAVRVGQGMWKAHLKSMVTHNARLCMASEWQTRRRPHSELFWVILCPFGLEVYLRSRQHNGLSVGWLVPVCSCCCYGFKYCFPWIAYIRKHKGWLWFLLLCFVLLFL